MGLIEKCGTNRESVTLQTSALRKRAAAVADAVDMEMADDAKMPKAAFIDLIVRHEVGCRSSSCSNRNVADAANTRDDTSTSKFEEEVEASLQGKASSTVAAEQTNATPTKSSQIATNRYKTERRREHMRRMAARLEEEERERLQQHREEVELGREAEEARMTMKEVPTSSGGGGEGRSETGNDAERRREHMRRMAARLEEEERERLQQHREVELGREAEEARMTTGETDQRQRDDDDDWSVNEQTVPDKAANVNVEQNASASPHAENSAAVTKSADGTSCRTTRKAKMGAGSRSVLFEVRRAMEERDSRLRDGEHYEAVMQAARQLEQSMIQDIDDFETELAKMEADKRARAAADIKAAAEIASVEAATAKAKAQAAKRNTIKRARGGAGHTRKIETKWVR
eukprot:SAG31_NODE_3256_length_4485_cov_2.283402_3_plen_402_part_00